VFRWAQERLGVTINEIFGQTEINYVVGGCAAAYPSVLTYSDGASDPDAFAAARGDEIHEAPRHHLSPLSGDLVQAALHALDPARAAELLKRFEQERAPLAAIALTTDTSVLTAVGNDFGFDQLFERQVRGLARAGDVLIAISTSGRSPNVLAALRAARESGVVTIGFTGSKPSEMTTLCDHLLAAPTDKTPLIQQIHIVAAHAICTCVEDALFGPRPA